MERQKILNPLTGRMVYADGVTAKNIPKMKKKVAVLEGAIQRKTTTKISEKKEAVGKLSGAIKRTLAKKPEPKQPEPKKLYTWDDLPDDIKAKISAIVKENSSRFDEDRDGYSLSGQGFLRVNNYITYVNQVLEDIDVSYETRMKLRKDAIENIKEANGDRIMVAVYSFNRKMEAFIKNIYSKGGERVPVISDLGTRAVFIVPDFSDNFYYHISGGYGGDGYAILNDGTYMSGDELYARRNKVEGYEDDPDADKIKLFGNPNLIATLEEDKYGDWEWKEPEYGKYDMNRKDKEYVELIKIWFKDWYLTKQKRVEPIPDWDYQKERFERDIGSGSGSGSRSSNSRSSNSRSYS